MSKLYLILSITGILLYTVTPSNVHAQTEQLASDWAASVLAPDSPEPPVNLPIAGGSALSIETPEVIQTADTLELERVTVTASKIPLTQRETTKPVLVIDRQQIERHAGKDLSQLLNEQNGIHVNSSYATPGTNKTLYIQGAGGEYSLILIDGVPVSDPSGAAGAIDLRLLPLENVERIEVIKGSQSTLYGTDAIAGVVNIITRSDTDRPFQANGTLSYGSYNSWDGSVGVAGQIADTHRYRFNYSRGSSDGFSAAIDQNQTGDFDDDGFERDTFSGKVTIAPVESLTVSPFLNYSSYEGDFDADAFMDAENFFSLDHFNPGIQVNYEQGALNLRGDYNYIHTKRTFVDDFGEQKYDGKFHNGDLYGIFAFSEPLTVLAGINYQYGKIPAEQTGNETGKEAANSGILSPYLNLVLKSGTGLNTELGYRLNIHTEYGNNATFNVAPSYNLTPELKIFASAGTGFKTPTLSELFGPFGANENLDPQKSLYLNFGAETYLSRRTLKVSAHYFHRKIEDLITFTFAEGFVNRNEQVNHGIEVSTEWRAGGNVTVRAHYNYLYGKLVTEEAGGEATTTSNLIRQPTHSVGGFIGVQLTSQLYVNLQGEINGERTDLFFNPENNFTSEEVILDRYSVVNAYAEYSVPDFPITFFGDVRNLLGSDFTEVYGFNAMGFTVKGGFRFNL